jgi:hypothetical protein
MKLVEFLRSASQRITLLGTTTLGSHLDESASLFADLLVVNDDLQITVLHESDSEIFAQSLCLDTPHSKPKVSYSSLGLYRDRIAGARQAGGLLADLQERLELTDRRGKDAKRVQVRQVNLRLPFNAVVADDRVWICFVTNWLPSLSDYVELETGTPFYNQVMDYIDFLTDHGKGGIFTSRPHEELIQLYDKQGFPRGIYPRAAFYNTKFQRYSVWGFVFNRRGQLLLHQRSHTTKDNRSLWDKSIGGHVDLRDYSTSITAKRELVEELFLPEAEFTRYMRADLGDIIDFGDWNLKKRPERHFKAAFAGLGQSDWILFRATDEEGDPLTVVRLSPRRINVSDENVEVRPTIFRSDVFLLIAPDGLLDTPEQMRDLVSLAERKGAAQDHRLIDVPALREWIEEHELKGDAETVFTNDLLYIKEEHMPLLERFEAFIRLTFGGS